MGPLTCSLALDTEVTLNRAVLKLKVFFPHWILLGGWNITSPISPCWVQLCKHYLLSCCFPMLVDVVHNVYLHSATGCSLSLHWKTASRGFPSLSRSDTCSLSGLCTCSFALPCLEHALENSCPKNKAKGKATCLKINRKIAKSRFPGTGKVNRTLILKDLKTNLIRQTQARNKEGTVCAETWQMKESAFYSWYWISLS